MKNNINEIWKSHLKDLSQSGVEKTRIDEINKLNCYIGTILKTKVKIFTISINKKTKIHRNYLKRFAGVEIQVLPSANKTKELTIILLEDELLEIFIVFIEDIIKSLKNIDNIEDALVVISKRINYWRKLFSKYTNRLLSPQQQRGLYGELYFIKLLLLNFKDHSKILNAWQAPMGSNQDFYFNKSAIEVKTSKSNSPVIKIANEFQLDITGLNKLFIAFYKLIEYPNDENTLLKLINEIRKVLKDNEELLSDFNQKLDYLGVSSNMESEYNKTSYAIRKEYYYDVNEEFPKITSDLVNDAISKVSYEITPNKCTEFEIEFTDILKEIN
jgi:hypothetical protein